EKKLRHLHARRAIHLGSTDRADAPRAVLRAENTLAVDGERLAVIADLALPAAVLRKPRRIHEDALAVVPGLSSFLDARGARDELEVRCDDGRILLEPDSYLLHRLDDVDRKRTDGRIRRLDRRAARGVE